VQLPIVEERYLRWRKALPPEVPAHSFNQLLGVTAILYDIS
jgi:hypothetical protein